MNWKKLSFWSGLGGVLFGTAVYAIKKTAPKVPPLYAEPIPEGIKRLVIDLEPHLVEEGDSKTWFQRSYVLEPTSFYIWSVLPAGKAGGAGHGIVSKVQGIQIFHVVPTVRKWDGEKRRKVGPGDVEEAFYATVRVPGEVRRNVLISQIARDYPVEFAKCLVGGSPNGIQTGEVTVSSQPVMDYQFDLVS